MKTFIHFIVFMLAIDYQRRSYCLCTYAIGAIFDRNVQDIITAFKYESKYLKEQKDALDFDVFAKYDLDATDSFAVSNEICLLLQKGVYGILGVSNTSALSTIQSYSNTFRVPFLALSVPQNGTNNGPFQLFMRPLYVNGLLHIILKYQWSNILYLYDSDEGLIRLQQLFQALNQREFALDIDVKRVTDPTDCHTILKEIHQREDTKEIRIFLDLPMKRAEETILLVKNDSKIKIHKFHFLLGELGIEEMNMQNFRTGGVNVTGFQLVNMTSTIAQKYLKTRQFYDKVEPKMRFEEALVIDALRFFYRALRDLTKSVRKQNLPERIIKCTDDSNVSPHNGSDMMEILKKEDINEYEDDMWRRRCHSHKVPAWRTLSVFATDRQTIVVRSVISHINTIIRLCVVYTQVYYVCDMETAYQQVYALDKLINKYYAAEQCHPRRDKSHDHTVTYICNRVVCASGFHGSRRLGGFLICLIISIVASGI